MLTETQAQIEVIKWFNEHCSDYSLPEFALFHICNEQPSVSRRALNKRLGVRSGAPDLVLTVPNDKYKGLFIELKRESLLSKKNATAGMSDNQIAFKDFLNSQGYLSVVCYGHQHAIATLKIYLRERYQ